MANRLEVEMNDKTEQAESSLVASRMACEMFPNLGVTPTEVSMVWPVWPPSPRQHRTGETK